METIHLQQWFDIPAETPANLLGAGAEDGDWDSPGKDAP